MSLGLGIFLSVVLIIVVWQVDKRGAWRKFGKLTAWLGAVVIVGGAAIGGYVWWDEHSTARARARTIGEEAKLVKAGTLTEYWGVKLGMSQDEVVYLKGSPTKRDEAKGDSLAMWSWGDNYEHVVLWDADGRVNGVVCNSDVLGACESVAGVRSDTLESELLATLGPPKISPNFSFAGKVYRYDTNTVSWQFILERERVRTIVLSSVEPKS
jgi:hypothetical protein